MARAGVTYHDVAKAAEAIKSRHQEPTVDRVREHLGTGSKSTIAPLLKRWRSDNGETADIGGLPNDLIEVVKSLHERVQQMADHRIEQARQEFEGFNQELRKELTDAKNTIVQLTARQQDLESQIERQNKEKGEAEKSLEDVRISLVKAKSQRDEAIARTTELKGSVAELKQENKDIREHFEHYQQRTAEDRQQERDQFRTITQGLKDQVRDLQHRLTQAESKASELSEANAQLQSNAGKLEQANVTLNRELNGKIEDIQDLKRDLEDALTKYRDSQHKNEQLAENVAVITTQKAEVEKQVAVLSQAFETAKAELKACQDKIAFLTDENKVILQEKALIQGQFKQLQGSL
ncbi:DNA-binding protein [Alteromonas macleodii]|uniref:Plasmid replication region DNA-binding N-term family protein n=2 Tax=Alteromonas macleodii TaxID=28108 RepID=A0AB36FKQ6_ALTMA|nr:DNA-binding protein [Alteromonas macleodii]OES24438.1 plasmid replication region DNA-binding N-term family protein [Alteromonas macleodii]OES25495.1 plasmid replication region DNA-binding N-term family protein [Alteromonas macleodii]OES25797.1 plasmid replication region DNA-binding N-term family protein [Alteromonas macleodii]OES38683.1 plasmid replication region DNA-binding N-term family protein [Alteromonas macleodii]